MMYATDFNTIQIGDFTVPSARFVLMPDLLRGQLSRQPTVGSMIYDHEEPTRLVDVFLAMNILRNFRVYMAYGDRRFHISPSTAATPTAPAPSRTAAP